jgi:hypothetical protein
VFSIVVLGLAAAAIGQAFTSAHAAVAARLERAQIDNTLQSLMEILQATPFADLAGGSQNVTICGQTVTLSWMVAATDLNGDAAPESSARLITATLGGRTLRCVVTDHTGSARPVKIP